MRRGHGGEVATGRGLSSPGLCLCVGVRAVTWIHSRDPHTLLPALLWSEEHGAGSRNYTGHCGLKEMFDKDSRGHPEADSKIGGDILWARVLTYWDIEQLNLKYARRDP